MNQTQTKQQDNQNSPVAGQRYRIRNSPLTQKSGIVKVIAVTDRSVRYSIISSSSTVPLDYWWQVVVAPVND